MRSRRTIQDLVKSNRKSAIQKRRKMAAEKIDLGEVGKPSAGAFSILEQGNLI